MLVLLFIIFRLMPGDPSKFFIKPGMDPDAYHLIAVRYGFEKEILTPGNKYEVVIDTTSPGAYGFAVNVSDTTGNNEKYYSTFNKPGMLYVNNNTTVYNVSISPQPGLNDPVGVNLELLCDSTCPPQFTVNVTHDGGVFNESLTITKGSTDIIGTQERADYIDTTTGTISEFGNYYVNFETKDDDGNAVYNIHGFSINKAPDELLPFTITNLYTEPTLSETRTKVVVSVTLTTSLDKIGLIVTTPAVTVLDQVTMYRSTLFVPVPYWEQFVIYMKNMLTFDFGNSFVSGRPVWDEISQRVPPTLLLFG
ncbi:MAG: hypothetical protein KAI64_04380, partial [Thermoplasmata archaeon]|nr:hypothetical protein [Thermoplasmata archaeon]